MKKAGYIVFFVCLGEFVFCLITFIMLLYVLLGVQSQGLKAEEFLLSEPSQSYLNTAVIELLDEGVHIEESIDQSMAAKYVSTVYKSKR